MTTVTLTAGLMLVGAVMFSARSPAVWVTGAAAFAAGCFLWFGMSVLCGPGPLMHCAIVQ